MSRKTKAQLEAENQAMAQALAQLQNQQSETIGVLDGGSRLWTTGVTTTVGIAEEGGATVTSSLRGIRYGANIFEEKMYHYYLEEKAAGVKKTRALEQALQDAYNS